MCCPTCVTKRRRRWKRPFRSLLLPKPSARWLRALLYQIAFYAFLQVFIEYRRSGSNRHGAFAPPDFESGASTNSATPAWRTATLYQCTKLLRQRRTIRQGIGPMVLDAVPATLVAGCD